MHPAFRTLVRGERDQGGLDDGGEGEIGSLGGEQVGEGLLERLLFSARHFALREIVSAYAVRKISLIGTK